MKCVTQFPQGLDHFIWFTLNYFIPSLGLCILGASMGSRLSQP
jgi:hypothetical protein